MLGHLGPMTKPEMKKENAKINTVLNELSTNGENN